MEIDKRPIPPYFQLKTLLLEAILGGELGPGARLPTEHELCERYALSRTPVSRALSELASEGVILRHRRRGSFVNPHWLRRSPDRPEVRAVVPEGPWAGMVQDAAPPELAVNVVTVPRPDLHQALTRAVAEGRGPDLALLDSVWLPEFAEAGFLHALDDLDADWVEREHEVDFLPPVVATNRYRGRTYGVSAFADVAGLWYRRDAFDGASRLPPATWSELRAIARTVTRDGIRHPIVIPGGSKGGETTSYSLISLLASNGAGVLGRDGVTLGSSATAQALRFAGGLVEEGLMSAAVVGYEWDRPARLLVDRHAALSFGGSYEARALAEGLGVPLAELSDHVGFAAVPGGPRGAPATATGAMVFAILRQAAQPKLAMRMLRDLTAPEAVAAVATRTGRIPARRSAIALVAPQLPFVAHTAEMLERAVTRPATPLYPRVSAQLQAMLEGVLTGRVRPAAAARRTADMIGAITGLPVVTT